VTNPGDNSGHYIYTANEADHRHCWCWKFSLGGDDINTGVTEAVFLRSFTLANQCRGLCAYSCAEAQQRHWRKLHGLWTGI
jgi:hypothetical protein